MDSPFLMEEQIMSFEVLHFRGSEKVFKEHKLVRNVNETLQYIDDVLHGSQYKGELFKQALDEMGWRNNGSLKIFEERRYQYKGFKKGIAIEANFSTYEFIVEGLARLQIGFDKQKVDAGILLLTSQRSEKSPYGSTSELVKEDVEKFLYPTFTVPVAVVLYDLSPSPVHAGASPTASRSDTPPVAQSNQKGGKSNEHSTSP